jgi:DNA ligase-4
LAELSHFIKIRHHVQRAGRQIGTAGDSPIAVGERLMIVLYNVMLLDDLFCARQNQDKRRDLLERLVYRISGQAEVGSRQVIRFSSTDAAESLRKAFSNAIAQRWEGLVLKGCHDLYPSFCQDTASVKLKKDCIPGLRIQPISLSLNYL